MPTTPVHPQPSMEKRPAVKKRADKLALRIAQLQCSRWCACHFTSKNSYRQGNIGGTNRMQEPRIIARVYKAQIDGRLCGCHLTLRLTKPKGNGQSRAVRRCPSECGIDFRPLMMLQPKFRGLELRRTRNLHLIGDHFTEMIGNCEQLCVQSCAHLIPIHHNHDTERRRV